MFYQGDLKSGIALAVQQSKAVLCFVHGLVANSPESSKTNTNIDHKENSKSWEEIISKDEQARPHVQKFGCKVFTHLHRLSKQSDEMLWPCGLLQAPKKPGSSLRSAPSSPCLLWS